MAAAYATFTADGLQRYPHFVSKITTPPARSFTGPRPKGPSRCSTTPRRRHRIAGNVTKTVFPVPSPRPAGRVAA